MSMRQIEVYMGGIGWDGMVLEGARRWWFTYLASYGIFGILRLVLGSVGFLVPESRAVGLEMEVVR